MKVNKLISKRVKVTKNGKLLVRSRGQNHYNAKESGEQGLKKRKMKSLSITTRMARKSMGSMLK